MAKSKDNNEQPQHIPPPEILEERRKRKFSIDPKSIEKEAQDRMNAWARALMKKHESKLSFAKYQHGDFVASGTVEAEQIDIPVFYNKKKWPDLHWVIHRVRNYWSVTLMSKNRLCAKYFFANLNFTKEELV